MAAATLDRHSPMPLWAQLLDDLRVRLGRGDFEDRFPTDRELVDDYDVSRHTAREAVRRLQVEGLLQRERGRGSRVRRASIEQGLGALYSLFRSVEAKGVEQVSVVRTLDVRRDPTAAEHLGLPETADLLYLSRLRFADGEPLAVDRAWLPADIARPLLSVDFTHTALYDELAQRCDVRIDGARERILPVLPNPDERAQLRLSAKQAAFRIERVGYAQAKPVEWRITIMRGDRFAFVTEWGYQHDRGLVLGSQSFA